MRIHRVVIMVKHCKNIYININYIYVYICKVPMCVWYTHTKSQYVSSYSNSIILTSRVRKLREGTEGLSRLSKIIELTSFWPKCLPLGLFFFF